MRRPRLVLIDSYAILHRAYYAIPKTNFQRRGELINAVYGYYSMLIRVIEVLKPKYLIACFDTPGITFRHEKFIAYQANRPEKEKELKNQIELVRETLPGSDIPILFKSGFEADDVMGTIARRFEKKEVVIVTGDKDLMQLVDENTKIFTLVKGVTGGELVDKKGVKQILGIKPSQVIDYKALVGDSSDNYPGVNGIGPKTAQTLLDEFVSLDKIYANLKKIKEIVRKKLEEGKESAYLSQELATIVDDVPVKVPIKKAVWNQDKLLKLKKVLEELNFPSLVKRIEKQFDQRKSEEQMTLL